LPSIWLKIKNKCFGTYYLPFFRVEKQSEVPTNQRSLYPSVSKTLGYTERLIMETIQVELHPINHNTEDCDSALNANLFYNLWRDSRASPSSSRFLPFLLTYSVVLQKIPWSWISFLLHFFLSLSGLPVLLNAGAITKSFSLHLSNQKPPIATFLSIGSPFPCLLLLQSTLQPWVGLGLFNNFTPLFSIFFSHSPTSNLHPL
jgi:hypothetical protein